MQEAVQPRPKRQCLDSVAQSYDVYSVRSQGSTELLNVEQPCFQTKIWSFKAAEAGQDKDDIINSTFTNGENKSNGRMVETPSTEICFGMIGPIVLHATDNPSLFHQPARTLVFEDIKVSRDGAIRRGACGTAVGSIDQRMGEILHVLDQEEKIRLQRRIEIRHPSQPKNRHKTRDKHLQSASFFVIVYGPSYKAEKIGDFLERYDVCLQTPQGCNTNTLYRNPHALSGQDTDALYTYDLDLLGQKVPWEGSNYLDDVEFPEDFTEADTPTAVTTHLFKHQRQALSFMLQRENSRIISAETRANIWEQSSDSGVTVYRNTISGQEQLIPPATSRGGILADEMGLGKTLTVAALIASDRDIVPPIPTAEPASESSVLSRRLATTLIIVPPTLLDNWENELKKHYSSGKMQWARHHRRSRFSKFSELNHLDIIITTYQTVEREYKMHDTSPSILFLARWHRIILDEAHLIRNNQSKAARSVCALEADRRWAVTGTPIQNHITDFVALLQFLRAAPYDEPSKFDEDIIQFWKADPQAAIFRLKRLIASISLRRTAEKVELPARKTYDLHLHFDKEERLIYEEMEAEAHNASAQCKSLGESQGRLIHVLQGVNALRMICNLGTLTDLKSFSSGPWRCQRWGPEEAQTSFNALVELGPPKCTHCRLEIATSMEPSLGMLQADMFGDQQLQPYISQCGLVICGSCVRSANMDAPRFNWCSHQPVCTNFPVSMKEGAVELTSSVRATTDKSDEWPTKIRALMHDLHLHPQSKSVVFSEWRTTLDLAARALDSSSVPYVRYDGTVTESGRRSALNWFSTDPNVKVILFTIRCGAVGLNLTAADRVYLMEPQWNPTVEDQAFARVHRLGQTKPVTAIRFVMADSYEQHIIMVQGRKKTFAEMALSAKKPPSGSGSFEYLKRVLV